MSFPKKSLFTKSKGPKRSFFTKSKGPKKSFFTKSKGPQRSFFTKSKGPKSKDPQGVSARKRDQHGARDASEWLQNCTNMAANWALEAS